MRMYSVYFPSEEDMETRLEKAVFIKEGFSWPALFFSWLFLALHRMWIVLVIFAALMITVAALLRLFEAPSQITILTLAGLTMMLAFEANALRGWSLLRRGYEFGGKISAANLLQAEEKLYETEFAACEAADQAREPSLCESPS